MANFEYITLDGIKVEAVQFKTDDQDLTRAWPRWFIDLLIDGGIMKNRDNGHWYLHREVKIQNGDWLVRESEPPHKLHLRNFLYFERNYRALDT